MTFIAGYIYKNAVHLVADSAVTGRTIDFSSLGEDHKTAFETSSFHETVAREGDKMSYEAARKLYNINDVLILAFAGTEMEGLGATQALKYYLMKEEPSSQKIADFFATNNFSNTHYILGFQENGHPQLFYYFSRRKSGFANLEGQMAVGGRSDGGTLLNSVHESIDGAISKGFKNDDLLTTTVATLQSLNLRARNMTLGIGGHFNGVYLSCDGVHWAKDCCYIMYSTISWEKGDKLVTFKFNRDTCTFLVRIASPSVISVFLEDPTHDWEEASRRYQPDILDRTNNYLAEYYVFAPYDKGAIIIINNKEGQNQLDVSSKTIVFNSFVKESMAQIIAKDDGKKEMHLFANFKTD